MTERERYAHRVTDAKELGHVACYDCATVSPMEGPDKRSLPKGWTAHALDGTAHCPACSESMDDYDVDNEDLKLAVERVTFE